MLLAEHRKGSCPNISMVGCPGGFVLVIVLRDGADPVPLEGWGMACAKGGVCAVGAVSVARVVAFWREGRRGDS